MRKKGWRECALPKLLLIAIMNKKRMPEGGGEWLQRRGNNCALQLIGLPEDVENHCAQCTVHCNSATDSSAAFLTLCGEGRRGGV